MGGAGVPYLMGSEGMGGTGGGAGVYGLAAGVGERARDGVCARGGVGAGVCERGRAAAAAEAEDWPGPGVCDRGGADLGGGLAEESAGVWERVGDSEAAGVVGREDIETDLECIELNRETGEVYDDWEALYGVGDVEMCAGDGDGVGDTEGTFGISGGVTPSVVASARSWLTCVCSCCASWDFWVYWDRWRRNSASSLEFVCSSSSILCLRLASAVFADLLASECDS